MRDGPPNLWEEFLMERQPLKIGGIPSLLWGEPSQRLVIAVHGSGSHKADRPIELLARQAVARGGQVLSFDLPEHGDRKQEPLLCKVQNCVGELAAVMEYAKGRWGRVGLFAVSMGAYFSLLAYGGEALEGAWFLSPVVDMRHLIETMMEWFQVTEERLRREGAVPTPMGQTLYWDYYCYVKDHPIRAWSAPTHILSGERDELCQRDTLEDFARQFHCHLEIVPEGEHYFHTDEQLRAFQQWLERTM